MPRHIVVFLLIASFGILFVGCGQPQPESDFEEFTFTDNDLQRVQDIVAGNTGSSATALASAGGSAVLSVGSASSVAGTTLGDTSSSAGTQATSSAAGTVASASTQVRPNAAKQREYDNLRLSMSDSSGNVYRVNNKFLNVRAGMDVGSAQIASLNQGDTMTVLDFPNGQWAKVRLSDGREGFVATRYIAKLTTELRLPEEKKQFEGKYYVNFDFLNIRKDMSAQSEKVGEIPGQAIIKPIAFSGDWARVSYGGKEGYVSAQYLEPFLPVFLVRQENYALPIVQFKITDDTSITALGKDIASLKAAGKKLVLLKSLYDLVQAQETRDARPGPGSVVLAVTGVNGANFQTVTNALQNAGASATLFIATKDLGISGITERMLLNAMANGNEIMVEGHTGDDLRSLTDSQVALELSQSKQLVEELTKKEVYAVAYPAGGANDRVMKKAAEMGYLFGLTQTPETQFTRGQFLRLPTIYVTGATPAEEVVKMVK